MIVAHYLSFQQFVNAQLMVNAESKMLRTSRRSDIGAAGATSDKVLHWYCNEI